MNLEYVISTGRNEEIESTNPIENETVLLFILAVLTSFVITLASAHTIHSTQYRRYANVDSPLEV